MEAACQRVCEFVQGCDQEAFCGHGMAYYAIVRNLEIIGEAAKGIPDEVRRRNAEVEWARIARARDIIAHHYFALEDETLWEMTTVHVPRLLEHLTEPAEQAGVGEVELRGLDEPPGEALEVRPEQVDDVARLEDRDPTGDCRLVDARVGAQGRAVEELPRTPRAEAQEAEEGVEVGDVREAPDVPLDVGPQVVVEPGRRLEAAVRSGRPPGTARRAAPAAGPGFSRSRHQATGVVNLCRSGIRSSTSIDET